MDDQLDPNEEGKSDAAHQASEENLVNESQGQSRHVSDMMNEMRQGRRLQSSYTRHLNHTTEFAGAVSAGVMHSGSGNINQQFFATPKDQLGIVPIGVELVDLDALYVAVPSGSHIATTLVHNRLVILHGHVNKGKYTSALHMLTRQVQTQIIKVDPNATQGLLLEHDFQPRHGYVIDGYVPAEAEKLRLFDLTRLRAKLQQQDSYMIMTLDRRCVLARDIVDEFVIEHNETADLGQIVRRRLHHVFPSQQLRQKAEDVLRQGDVQQLIKAMQFPREAVMLADSLEKVVRGDIELATALDSSIAHVRQQIEAWYAQHTSLRDRCFMLTLAVLSGASYQAVVDAEKMLRGLPEFATEAGDNAAQEAVFDNTVKTQVAEACARFTEGYETAEFGRSAVRLVEFKNSLFQQAVLDFVWGEYDRLHAPLLSWLCTLGQHRNFDVRIRAALAVGYLCRLDFAVVLREVVRCLGRAP